MTPTPEHPSFPNFLSSLEGENGRNAPMMCFYFERCIPLRPPTPRTLEAFVWTSPKGDVFARVMRGSWTQLIVGPALYHYMHLTTECWIVWLCPDMLPHNNLSEHHSAVIENQSPMQIICVTQGWFLLLSMSIIGKSENTLCDMGHVYLSTWKNIRQFIVCKYHKYCLLLTWIFISNVCVVLYMFPSSWMDADVYVWYVCESKG